MKICITRRPALQQETGALASHTENKKTTNKTPEQILTKNIGRLKEREAGKYVEQPLDALRGRFRVDPTDHYYQ